MKSPTGGYGGGEPQVSKYGREIITTYTFLTKTGGFLLIQTIKIKNEEICEEKLSQLYFIKEI